MKVKSRKETKKILAMRSHAEHIRFQLESIIHEDEDLASSQSTNSYLNQISSLVSAVFQDDDDDAHDRLIETLKSSQGYIQENATSYRTQQQLAELFYDLSLLLARRRPLNQLKKANSVIIFTSSQYQYD